MNPETFFGFVIGTYIVGVFSKKKEYIIASGLFAIASAISGLC